MFRDLAGTSRDKVETSRDNEGTSRGKQGQARPRRDKLGQGRFPVSACPLLTLIVPAGSFHCSCISQLCPCLSLLVSAYLRLFPLIQCSCVLKTDYVRCSYNCKSHTFWVISSSNFLCVCVTVPHFCLNTACQRSHMNSGFF